MLKLLNKFMIFGTQKRYLISFLFFGVPIGYLVGEGIKIWMYSWIKYHFSIESLLFTLFFDLILISPLIINYFIQMKKQKLLIKRYYNKTLIYKVKAKFDYKEFKKSELYEIHAEDFIVNNDKKIYFFVIPTNNFPHPANMEALEDIINKFELVDNLKEQRRKKLKKLTKIK